MGLTMYEDVNSKIKTHQASIDHYCSLLATELTQEEREFVHRRIVAERLEVDRLLNSMRPKTREVHSARQVA